MRRNNNNGDFLIGALIGGILALIISGIASLVTKKKQIHQEQAQRPPLQPEHKHREEKPSVDHGELKRLFQELSKRYHPDFAQSERDKEFRTQLFVKIKKAYDEQDIETLRVFKI